MPHEVQDGLFNLARSFRNEGREVIPIAFLLCSEGLCQVHLFQLPKTAWRATILDGIKATKAVAVIVHTEAWVVMGNDASAAMAAKMAGLDSLQEFPGRKEILQSMMESANGTVRTLTAFIEEGKLGPTKVSDIIPMGGEMPGFFTRSDRVL